MEVGEADVREWVGVTGQAAWSQAEGEGRRPPEGTGRWSRQCGLAGDDGKLRMHSKLEVDNHMHPVES